MLLIAGLPQLRDVIAEFGFGHAASPGIFVELRVRVATDQTVFDLHRSTVLPVLPAFFWRIRFAS
jgi:hypothetical protein